MFTLIIYPSSLMLQINQINMKSLQLLIIFDEENMIDFCTYCIGLEIQTMNNAIAPIFDKNKCILVNINL